MRMEMTAKAVVSVLSALSVLAGHALAEDVLKNTQGGLVVTIVPSRDKIGTTYIDRGGSFSVLFTNRTENPIRLWNAECQPGYAALSLRIVDDNNQSTVLCKQPREFSDWNDVPPRSFTIAPGSTVPWRVSHPCQDWKGLPEPNTGHPFILTAIFEIKPTNAAKAQGIWTGRVTSEPVTTFIVDPRLKTPQDYLQADCPRQALKLMEDTPSLLARTDDEQQTPLHVAAYRGLTEITRWLLAHGADVNARAYNQLTPLHLASKPEIVRLLLAYKAEVNAESVSGTALQEAASQYAHLGRFPKLSEAREAARTTTKLLLDAGAKYDIRSACFLNDVDRVRTIIKEEAQQALNKHAMRAAAGYGRTEIVKLLLDGGADPEDADYGGLTVSYFAIEYPVVLKVLFGAGADPKVTVDYHGNGNGPHGSTLLHEAADKGCVESSKLLLSRGVNTDATTPEGFTPLHVACCRGHAAMVEFLLESKANPRAQTKDGWTPMALAAAEVCPREEKTNVQYQAIIGLLERAGVEVEMFASIARDDTPAVTRMIQTDPRMVTIRNPNGEPALDRAVTLDRREIVRVLLANGCDPDIQQAGKETGENGRTPLLNAAFWDRREIAEMLIRHGANVNATVDNGFTPLHQAARMGHADVVRLLIGHGADVNAKDKDGKTPLDWAGLSNTSTPEMVELLTSGNAARSKPE